MTGLSRVRSLYLDGIEPPEALLVSEWADRFRMLSSKETAEPGQWRTERTPHLREPMDRLGGHDPCETLVLMFASQVGKSEVINNWIGHTIQIDPCPVLMVQPTVERAEEYSKARIAPMLSSCPSLVDLVGDVRSRATDNTILGKSFPGGVLSIVGANAPSGLASKPIRRLACDEVDRFPASAGSEGDPVELAIQRTANFDNRKILLTSTPTNEGESRISEAFAAGDQRRAFVPCPHCGTYQVLMWAGFAIERDEGGRVVGVSYFCGEGASAYAEAYPDSTVPGIDGNGCGAEIVEADKVFMFGSWDWRPTAVASDPTVTSYHLPGWYSPLGLGWSWRKIAQAFVNAKGDPERLRVVVNTRFAETWTQQDGETLDDRGLLARREDWGCGDDPEQAAVVPDACLLITSAADIQGNRIEVLHFGWGKGEEGWPLRHVIMWGEPAVEDRIWEELGEELRFSFDGDRTSAVSCVDSGYLTDRVYRFVKPLRRYRIWGIKGIEGGRRPIWSKRPMKQKKKAATVYDPFLVGVDAAKDVIFDRLALVDEPGSGYIHIPQWADLEWIRQLTAEAKVITKRRGHPVRTWHKVRARNEVLDLMVYNLAALRSWQSGGRSLDRLAAEEGGEREAMAAKPSTGRDWLGGSRGLTKGSRKSWL